MLLPIVDQHVSRCGVLVLFPGKAAPDLDVGAKKLAGPRLLVAGGLRHRLRNAGQNDRLMALDACPKLIEIGYGQEGEVGIRDSSHRLLIDVVGILAGTRAEDYLVVGIKVRKHAFHVYKELHCFIPVRNRPPSILNCPTQVLILRKTPTELQDDFEAKPALRLAHAVFDLSERGNGGVNQLAVGQFPVVVLMCCHLGLLGASIHTNSLRSSITFFKLARMRLETQLMLPASTGVRC